MEVKYKINVAKDFSAYPAGRFRTEGKASGEAFLLDHILGKLLLAFSEKCILEIDLTGMNGYPSSFISGSFGKISYEMGKLIGQDKASALFMKHLSLKCEDSAARIKAVQDEINTPVAIK
ncbi:hypothetical protein FNO01nite_29540 [Flavobacterium noncentrifugens]|uniref:DUF4325 domain-containing protein n=1 Tax=Flavobacterium noncentrifugens TaxID=1128970 RepID=A0A1G8Y2B3_9FLAO|nr:DUF4325 domain-containing protein [Flavobacterium noncentrifugens]GEP52282.1 hypothetical protein FNO01nite_29540 [Flavobacterium noncentrifugens]SDJ96921.1 hypothetical protein SAMN04487935_2163 [Flavobacterium noncentrifugens]